MCTVTCDGNRVTLNGSYHPNLPTAAKRLGGRWDGARKTWTFDARDEERVRKMARRIYGTDGSAPVQLITVRHRITTSDAMNDTVWLGGRQIATRRGRDLDVQLGEGVIIIEGRFPEGGGSVKYPALKGDGVVLEIRDLPASLVRPEEGTDTWLVETVPAPEAPNPLADYIDDQLLAELRRRHPGKLINLMISEAI